MISSKILALCGLYGGLFCCGLSIGIIPANRYSALRQGLGTAGVAVLLGGYAFSQKAIKEQIEIDRLLREYEAQQKLLKEATQPVMVEEAKNNATISAEYRQQLHELNAGAAFAHVAHENHPAWVQQQLKAASIKPDIEEAELLGESEDELLLPNKSEDTQQKSEKKNSLAGAELPLDPNIGIKFFNWKRFKKEPHLFPHIRAVGATGIGKTRLIDWLLDVFPSEKKQVITVKRRVEQWEGLKVVGVPEDFEAIRFAFEDLQDERKSRTEKMAKGVDLPTLNVAVDEWRVISKKVKAIVDRVSKNIISPSAKEVMTDTLCLAREVNIRLLVMAQGRQVETWGLEGESDLAECFCSIYLGRFAVEECESYRNRYLSDSHSYDLYQAVCDYLKTLGSRAAWVSCADGEYPAIVPDLSEWKRGKKVEVKTTTKDKNSRESLTEDLPAELLDRARQRLQLNFETAHPEVSPTSSNSDAIEVREASGEVPEVPICKGSSDSEVLPSDERAKALGRVLGLLSHGKVEVIELIPIEPDKALWLGIKTLKMRLTPASQNVFDCGTGGSNFQKAKTWYNNLENKFGKIID